MIAITPVVAQDLDLRELVDVVLASTGKDLPRIQDLLRRGSIVHGLSRYRWQSLELQVDELAVLLSSFPDPDPSIPFSGERCTQIVLSGHLARIPIPKEAAVKRRLLKRTSFWDKLIEVAPSPDYQNYSYRDKMDVFRATVPPGHIREAAALLTYSTLVRQLEAATIEIIEFLVRRV